MIKKVGRLKKPIIILCAFALFILPITNILLAHPALASKDPSRFSNLKENDQYKFFTYASAMAQCFNKGGDGLDLTVHTDVDDQMLNNNVVFANWGSAYVYVGTYPEVKGFNGGGINCTNTGFQQEAFNTFGISPNELLCYMGYPKNGLKGKNDSNAKHEECVALGLTNDFTYNGMPYKGGENFLNALTALTGYDRSVAEKNAYIKYRKYSDWMKQPVSLTTHGRFLSLTQILKKLIRYTSQKAKLSTCMEHIAPSLNFHASQLKVNWQLQLKDI